MKWRTDKPTADIIVVFLKGSCYPQVLEYDKEKQCYLEEHNSPVNIQDIEKWADLEEDKTVTDNKERIEYLAKAVKILGELRYNKTASIVNEVRIELKGNKKGTDVTDFCQPIHPDIAKDLPEVIDEIIYGKDEAVMEHNELNDEIHKVWKTCEPTDEGMGVEIANIHIEQFDSIARHFAKWGVEHRDRFLNWIRDLIKKGIEKPEEALNILKRIDTLINDNSLWAEHLKK